MTERLSSLTQQVSDWLSGVLIGDEIRSARRWAEDRGIDGKRVRLIGEGALVGRYSHALGALGIAAEEGPAAAAALGLYRIAHHAGLIVR